MSSRDQCHKFGFQIVQNLKRVITFILNLIIKLNISIFKSWIFNVVLNPTVCVCVCMNIYICSVYVCAYTPYINN